MTRFSIIIPTYNYAHVLPRALNSVLAQTGDDFEIIVMDDGSTDNTQQVVEPFLSNRRICYIFQPNQGPAVARNRGISLARGDYVLLLDADDELLPQALSQFRDFIRKQPEMEVIVAGYRTVKDGHIRQHALPKISNNPLTNFLNYFRKKIALANGALLIKKTVFKKISYPEKFLRNEDVPVFSLCLALCKVAVLPVEVLQVNAHANSIRHQKVPNISHHLDILEEIFRQDLLPAQFMAYRSEVHSCQALSLFRSLLQQGEKKTARAFYHQAIAKYPKHIFQMSYLRKYLLSYL